MYRLLGSIPTRISTINPTRTRVDANVRDVAVEHGLAAIDSRYGTTRNPDPCCVRRVRVGANTDSVNARGMALAHREA